MEDKKLICKKGYTSTYKQETQTGSYETKTKVNHVLFYIEENMNLENPLQVKGILTIEDPNLLLAGFRKNIMPGRDYVAAVQYKGLVCVSNHLLYSPEHLIRCFLEGLQITKVVAE